MTWLSSWDAACCSSSGKSARGHPPTVSREQSQQASIQRLIETVFDGSSESLVLTLLNGTLSKSEADRIRKIISAARKKS